MNHLSNAINSIIKRLLIQDESLSPDAQYQVNLLRIIMYSSVISTTLMILYALLGYGIDTMLTLSIGLLVIGLNLAALWRMNADNLKLIGRVVVGIAWIAMSIAAYFSGGLYSAATLGLIVLSVVAYLLFDERDRTILYGLTIAYFCLLLVLGLSANLPDAPTPVMAFRMIVLCLSVTILLAIVYYHLVAIRQSEKRITQLQVDGERFRVQQELTQDLAHDLRTPLSTLQTTAYLIRQRHERDMPIEETIQKLEDQVHRMNSMIEDLFQMTLMDIDDKKRTLVIIDLQDMLSTCMVNAAPFAQTRHITISLNDMTRAKSRVIGDPQQLVRVFDNLIQNAIHYGREGGFIKISIALEEPYHMIRVQDNGIGIAIEHQGKVFERFYRVDEARTAREKQGAGVGLNAAQRIVQFHGGVIYLSSNLGEGSTFTVALPSIDHVEPVPPFNRVNMKYKSDDNS